MSITLKIGFMNLHSSIIIAPRASAAFPTLFIFHNAQQQWLFWISSSALRITSNRTEETQANQSSVRLKASRDLLER